MPVSGLDQIAKVIEERVTLQYRGLVLETCARIVKRTPVDTGRAKGNWQFGTTPASDEIERLDPTGSAVMLDVVRGVGALGLEQCYFVNNLPYITALEHGHSTQAPAGMVGVTLAEVGQIAERIAQQNGAFAGLDPADFAGVGVPVAMGDINVGGQPLRHVIPITDQEPTSRLERLRDSQKAARTAKGAAKRARAKERKATLRANRRARAKAKSVAKRERGKARTAARRAKAKAKAAAKRARQRARRKGKN